MSLPITDAKAALREAVRSRLKATSAAHRVVEAAQICARLKASGLWRAARAVLLFAPLRDEPDLWPMLEFALHDKKMAALPCFDAEQDGYVARQIADPVADLRKGRFGIREPGAHCPELPLNRLDLILVPGVAFDPHGRRLGRGKGFYDRLLASVSGDKCGIAFDEQIVGEVPAGPHDIQLNCILTPTRWIET